MYLFNVHVLEWNLYCYIFDYHPLDKYLRMIKNGSSEDNKFFLKKRTNSICMINYVYACHMSLRCICWFKVKCYSIVQYYASSNIKVFCFFMDMRCIKALNSFHKPWSSNNGTCVKRTTYYRARRAVAVIISWANILLHLYVVYAPS